MAVVESICDQREVEDEGREDDDDEDESAIRKGR